MNRPEYFHIYKDGDFDWRDKAEIIIAKHRNGATGDVRLTFRKEYARFMNMNDESLGNIIPSDIPVVRASKMNANVEPEPLPGEVPDYMQQSPGTPVDFIGGGPVPNNDVPF